MSQKFKVLLMTSLFLFSCVISHSQESNIRFQERTNNETERRLLRVEGGLSLSGGILTGILPISQGGTGINYVDPDADRILFWDDSEGTIANLTIGTGLTLIGTNLTANVPIYTLVDSNELTTVTESGDLTIESGKHYKLRFFFHCHSTNDSQIFLRFNNDSTGNDYKYWLREHDITANTDTPSNSDSANEIILTRAGTNGLNNDEKISGTLLIDSIPNAVGVHVHGKYYHNPQTPGNTFYEIDGWYQGAEITSVEFVIDNAVQNANTYLYKNALE